MTNTATSPLSDRAFRRRGLAIGAACVLVVAVLSFTLTRDSSAESASNEAEPTTAIVEQRDLVISESLTGIVEDVDQTQIVHRIDEDSVGASVSTGNASPTAATATQSAGSSGGGTTTAQAAVPYERITSVITAGTVVEAGDVLYTVDGVPVFALFGTSPAWRDLDASSDDGVDILQLETSLSLLGYNDDGAMEVDEVWDANTTAAVAEWQLGRGVNQTGTITLGDIAFLPDAAVVESVSVAVGDDVTDGSVIMTIDAKRAQIRADVPADLQSLVAAGTVVRIGDTEHQVERLVSGVTDGAVTVQAIVVAQSGEATAGTSVTLRLSETMATDALVVPAAAISNKLDGSYAVRMAGNGAARDWVTVLPVAQVDGDVAIESALLQAGDFIVSP